LGLILPGVGHTLKESAGEDEGATPEMKGRGQERAEKKNGSGEMVPKKRTDSLEKRRKAKIQKGQGVLQERWTTFLKDEKQKKCVVAKGKDCSGEGKELARIRRRIHRKRGLSPVLLGEGEKGFGRRKEGQGML